jgi:hypothetical protein
VFRWLRRCRSGDGIQVVVEVKQESSAVPEEPQPQKCGMDVVAAVSDGVESEANAHEGVER